MSSNIGATKQKRTTPHWLFGGVVHSCLQCPSQWSLKDHQVAISAIGRLHMEKLPKTKEEIAQLIITELRSFDCMRVLGVVIVPIVDHTYAATWTVSCFNAGKSDGETCDRALQHIVPRFQRIYELIQKH